MGHDKALTGLESANRQLLAAKEVAEPATRTKSAFLANTSNAARTSRFRVV
jgi:hypothetical protein